MFTNNFTACSCISPFVCLRKKKKIACAHLNVWICKENQISEIQDSECVMKFCSRRSVLCTCESFVHTDTICACVKCRYGFTKPERQTHTFPLRVCNTEVTSTNLDPVLTPELTNCCWLCCFKGKVLEWGKISYWQSPKSYKNTNSHVWPQKQDGFHQ